MRYEADQSSDAEWRVTEDGLLFVYCGYDDGEGRAHRIAAALNAAPAGRGAGEFVRLVDVAGGVSVVLRKDIYYFNESHVGGGGATSTTVVLRQAAPYGNYVAKIIKGTPDEFLAKLRGEPAAGGDDG